MGKQLFNYFFLALKTIALLVFLVVIFIFYILGIFQPVFDGIGKISCTMQRKEFLTQSNGKRVCVKKFSDAGKQCNKKDECQGFCIQSLNRCSEYPWAKDCYKEYTNSPSELDSEFIKNDQGVPQIVICPPHAY